MSGLLVTVIIPTYNRRRWIGECLDSVRAQTYSRWELCLAHGAPEDVPARAWLRTQAQDDRRIKVDLLSENLGISGNSNRALALATGTSRWKTR